MPVLSRIATGAAKGYGFTGRPGRTIVPSTLDTNATQVTVTASNLPGYVAGRSDITITINAGVIITSTSTATPALTITGAAAGDRITIVNNGYIFGMGGNGGRGSGWQEAVIEGSPGGPAIQLTSLTNIPLTVRNNGVIGGGGGGGGGGGFGRGTASGFTIVCGGSGGGGGVTNGITAEHGQSLDSLGTTRKLLYFNNGTPIGHTPAGGTPPAYTFGTSPPPITLRDGPTAGTGGNGGTIGSAGGNGAAGSGNVSGGPGALGGLAGKAINLNGAVYTAAATAVTLSSVGIGASGTFTCAATTIRFGQQVTITGTNTGTGSITGYVSGAVYYVIATNGSTTFTLSATWNGTAIASTAGTSIGLTFSLDGTTAGVIS